MPVLNSSIRDIVKYRCSATMCLRGISSAEAVGETGGSRRKGTVSRHEEEERWRRISSWGGGRSQSASHSATHTLFSQSLTF